MPENIYSILFLVSIIILVILICLCLAKAVIGPSVTDRIVAVNMIGTLIIITIAILAMYLNESGLLDVSLIYAMMSFLAVVVLTKIYLGVYIERQKRNKQVSDAEEKAEETK